MKSINPRDPTKSMRQRVTPLPLLPLVFDYLRMTTNSCAHRPAWYETGRTNLPCFRAQFVDDFCFFKLCRLPINDLARTGLRAIPPLLSATGAASRIKEIKDSSHCPCS
jgi:hypothetical protein